MGLVQNIATSIKNAWDAVEEMGGEIPENKNLANLPAGIMSIPTGPLPPGVPTTLTELKQMLNKGQDIEIGTEIPDTWGGRPNPLIVGTNTNINGRKAVGLLRKYIEQTSQVYGGAAVYANSTILNYLNSTYLNSCSAELKGVISNSSVSSYNGSSIQQVSGKWHLLSGIEVCGTYTSGEGQMWEYWRNVTGLNTANNNSNDGRIGKDKNGNAYRWWLRSRPSSTALVATVNVFGQIDGNSDPNGQCAVLPFCYVTAD